MILIQITNLNTNEIGWMGEFDTQDLATAWVVQGTASNWWGKPLRTLTADINGNVKDVDGSTPDLTKAISTGTVSVTNSDQTISTVNTYTFAAEYTVTQTDITAQVNAQAALQKGLQAQTVGATCVAQVYALNEAKFAAGTLTTQDFQNILQDVTLLQIERLLWNGSLVTAKAMMAAYTSPYFTTEDIASVIAIIDNSGL